MKPSEIQPRGVVSAGLALLAVTAPAGKAVAQDASKPVAFVGVNVVSMARRGADRNQTVIVRDGRIAEIGLATMVPIPAGAVRVDGREKFLMPGLAEMHGHIPPPTTAAEVTEAYLALYVLRGVTTVRTMFGYPNQFKLRDRIRKGDILGPTIYTASPAYLGDRVEGPEHARQLVQEHKKAGYDLLKIHEGLSPEEYEAIVQTAKAARIKYAGHVPNDVGVRRAIVAGQDIDHLDGYYDEAGDDDATIAEIAKASQQAGISLAPTLDLWKRILLVEPVDDLRSRGEMRYVPRATLDNWVERKVGYNGRVADPEAGRREIAARNRTLKALYDAGARILLGSDAPQIFSVPGFSLEHEMPAMVEAGIPNIWCAPGRDAERRRVLRFGRGVRLGGGGPAC